jgi:hypothetical protein
MAAAIGELLVGARQFRAEPRVDIVPPACGSSCRARRSVPSSAAVESVVLFDQVKFPL